MDTETATGSEPAKMRSRGRRKQPPRKRFDRMLSKRIGRRDVVNYLARELRTSAAYVSRMLDAKTPRRNHSGQDFNMWARLKAKLTAEEIKILEEME